MPVIPGNNFNQRCVVHFPDGICRTIMGGGGSGGYHAGNEPKVMVMWIKQATKQGIIWCDDGGGLQTWHILIQKPDEVALLEVGRYAQQ